MKLGGIDIHFDTVKKDLKPKMVDGRIDPIWFEENISREAKLQGYDVVVFQFSKADGRKWKLKKGLHGSNLRDGDFFGESYICCDEHEVWKFPDETWNTYEKTVPHEIGHELTRQGFTKLEVHDFDYKKTINNLRGFYKMYKLEQEAKKVKWCKYLPEPYFSRITQQFLEVNPAYKTGLHIGVDHGTQGVDNVPVYMPVAGKITRHYTNDPVLGNCAVVLSFDGNWAFRFCHLRDEPVDGEYNAGDQIGIVGNTGMSTGIHLHVDAWKDGFIRVEKLVDRASIEKYCVDAHELVTKNL